MLELIIENSESRFVGLDKTRYDAVKTILSFTIPQTYGASQYAPYASFRTLLKRNGSFPTGLLNRLKYFLDEIPKSELKITDNRIVPRPTKRIFESRFKFKPYYEQEIAAAACKRAHRGVIVAPTGVGKSAIIGLIIRELQVPTLIVVPSLELKRQLTAFFKEVYSDYVNRKDILRVENIDALRNVKELKGFQCLIIDEFHHSAAKTYKKLNQTLWKDIYYKFGLTATYFRTQEHENIYLESILAEVLYTIPYKTAVDKGYIVPMEAYSIIGYQTGTTTTKVNYNSYSAAYNALIVKNNTRNYIIADTLLRLYKGKVSTLCLVKEIAHGNALSELTGIPFANGESPECKDLIKAFNHGTIPVLIGTTGVLGEGVDTKPCEYVIVATPIKSKALFMQAVGRSFRKFEGKETCKILLIEDNSHKWFKAAYKEQVKILTEEYNTSVTKLI